MSRSEAIVVKVCDEDKCGSDLKLKELKDSLMAGSSTVPLLLLRLLR